MHRIINASDETQKALKYHFIAFDKQPMVMAVATFYRNKRNKSILHDDDEQDHLSRFYLSFHSHKMR